MSGLGLLFWMDLHESSGDSAAYQKNTEYEIAPCNITYNPST